MYNRSDWLTRLTLGTAGGFAGTLAIQAPAANGSFATPAAH
ncbi:MAG TPA: hypothetical protein VGX03_06945 [Candidatus Binatia bacterium]|jgi:hypothetical protein|nr:hypothetical protein [Candidatus Binatia bacterium]